MAVIDSVLFQHADEAACIHQLRSRLVGAPGVTLRQLARFDDRLSAHLEGLQLGGEAGVRLCDAGLADASAPRVFTAAVLALETRDVRRLERLLSLAQALAEARRGLVCAFGWVSASHLRGTVHDLLMAPEPLRRALALAACSMHHVDPGPALARALEDPEPMVRARALRVAAERGRIDLRDTCIQAALSDGSPAHALQAAVSAVVLGDRGPALRALVARIRTGGLPQQRHALAIVMRVCDLGLARSLLAEIAVSTGNARIALQACGLAGAALDVPWLLEQACKPEWARLAGEAFSLITGADLAALQLERSDRPEADAGPDDNPEDPRVALDDDEGLPWPDVPKVAAWWKANADRFPPGVRHFMGQPPSPAHCLAVLKTGSQRQRIAAAEHLCLLRPGTPLFNTAAPAWCQQRLLARMG